MQINSKKSKTVGLSLNNSIKKGVVGIGPSPMNTSRSEVNLADPAQNAVMPKPKRERISNLNKWTRGLKFNEMKNLHVIESQEQYFKET